MKKVIAEYEQEVDLSVPAQHRKQVLHKLNIFHIGKETVPLDQEWPPGKNGVSMEKIHHNFAMTHRITITVQVLEDGSLRMKK